MYSIKKLALFVWAIAVAIVFVGCSKDGDPHDEEHHDHEMEWSKVEMTFRRGHLHGINFHGNPENSLFPTQKFIFEKDETGKIIRKNTEGKILSDGEQPLILQAFWQYALEIVYFNEKGERINADLTSAENLPKHQHFFTVEKYTDTKTSQVIDNQAGLMDYVYRDTNPENVQVNMAIDPNNPRKGRSVLTNDNLGLKGYFTPKIAYTKFDMRIVLLHFSGNKNTNPMPFNAPYTEILTRGEADFQAVLPVHIYTKPNSGEVGDYERYINDLAEFFGKTADEIKDLIRKATEEGENSAYWM